MVHAAATGQRFRLGVSLSHPRRSIERVFGVFGALGVLDALDALDVLDDAVAKVAASEALLDVVRLRALANRVELVWLRAIAAAERRGEWHAQGYLSAAAWVRHRCGLTHPAAIDALGCARTLALGCARTLDAMPALAGAFEAAR